MWNNDRGGAILPLVLGVMFVLMTFVMLSGLHHQRAVRATAEFNTRLTLESLMKVALDKAMKDISTGVISGPGRYKLDFGICKGFEGDSTIVSVGKKPMEYIVELNISHVNRPVPMVYSWKVYVGCQGNNCGILEIGEIKNSQ